MTPSLHLVCNEVTIMNKHILLKHKNKFGAEFKYILKVSLEFSKSGFCGHPELPKSWVFVLWNTGAKEWRKNEVINAF